MNKFLKWILYKKTTNSNIMSVFMIGFMIVVFTMAIYFSGGTTSLVHSLYVPIIFSVIIFGRKGGFIAATISGLAVGPYMPASTYLMIMQGPSQWIFRILFFNFIAFLLSKLIESLKTYHILDQERAFVDKTGYPSINKLVVDINKRIESRKDDRFSAICFEFKNMSLISRYISNDVSENAFLKILEIGVDNFYADQIYVISYNKFIVFLPGHEYKRTVLLAGKFIEIFEYPIYVDSLPISVVLECGIASYPMHCNDGDELVKKLRYSLKQASALKTNIVVYNDFMEIEGKRYYKILVSLYHSLQNNSFYLVYQPKYLIKEKRIIGVEALIRIDDEIFKSISIGQFIQMAEEVGFIGEISKWVIENAVNQIKKWQEMGIYIPVSVNLSPLDFNDERILNYTNVILKRYGVSPCSLEFEMTERSLIEDEEKVFGILRKIKDKGIDISIDDYGTGYNSIKYLSNRDTPFNFIKIDKIFVDKINERQNQLLLYGIIESAHASNIRVVAEGVETKEQLKLLEIAGCDIAQGYYLSKPLSPQDLINILSIDEMMELKV